MRHATTPVHQRVETIAPPRARRGQPPLHPGAVAYDSENYAMLNSPIETERHMRRVVRFLRPRPGDRVLEIGCGRGWLTQRVQELCPLTCGIDVNPRSIAHAVTDRLTVMDAVDLNFEDAQFDNLYSFHAIEHIVETNLVLAEMYRVLVPGGRALLVYPAEPIRGLYAMPGAWLGFGNPFLARKLHVHKFSPGRIRALAERSGFLYVESTLDFLITPQFVTLLQKPLGAP